MVKIPGTNSIQFFLNFSLSGDELLHLVRVLHDFRLGKFFVDGFKLFQQVSRCLHTFFNNLFNRLRFVQLRLLFEHTDGEREIGNHFALEFLVHAGDDPEEGGLARAVQTEDADLGAVEKGEINVF